MTFTILDGNAVNSLFSSLKRAEVLDMAQRLSNALSDYSKQDEKAFQPHRASVVRPDGQTTLFMPATSPKCLATKIIGLPPSTPVVQAQHSQRPFPTRAQKPESVLILCDAQSRPLGILNAEETTAVRTALGSMLMYMRRRDTDNMVVFGAGKQALWHIRLALLLRGHEIKKITVVNRTSPRSEALFRELLDQEPRQWQSSARFDALSSQDPRYDKKLESLLLEAHVIFCATPSTTPLFPAHIFEPTKDRKSSPYIAAIGSYKVNMTELDPLLLLSLTASHHENDATGKSIEKILVDSREGCLAEAGEIIEAKISPEKLVEVGELLAAFEKSAVSRDMVEWLATGIIVYKSVGLGIMDLVMGEFLISQATQKQLGFVLDSM